MSQLSSDTAPSAQEPATGFRSRRVRALLAGGLVLGLGAAVTLAAWNGSEFAKAQFAAGSFAFTGSTDGVTFASHPSAGAAASLTVTGDVLNLAPGDETYLPYAVKLEGSNDATVTAVDPVVDGTFAAGELSFSSAVVPAWGCDGSADFAAGSAESFTMSPDDVVNLCLRVTAAEQSSFSQGATGTVTWQFDAVTS
ncbi:SipW-dependent-type signal peptide-containing protein [Leucobacter sp. M11]|uniref:SipW-dependent-type signal peptide-containing protein n=1 Tax=Leucobacter sp. M11 TaxID=2993565 RepID=UPI002D80238F|nr:SipW-dependent-type signal peptide-containing protein [Leucobacter sp. M11]MEB4614667.1 SipW-dependent-type signal peptide-containing protein [Leucobacter sp. M11]